MLLLFVTVTLLLCSLVSTNGLAESTEAASILITTLDDNEVVNASCTVDLLCLAHGSTSAPSIEWLWITNGKTAIINNTVYNPRYTIYERKQDIFTESILRIENILLEDEGLYSCATRLNNGELSASAHNKKITVLSGANSKGSGRAKLGGAAAGGVLALILLVGALVVLWYYGQQERKKYRSRVLIRNKNLVDQFILSNKTSKISESALQYSVEGAATTTKFNTDLEGNTKKLIIHKTDIQLMNIIGEGERSHVYQAKLQMPIVKTHYHVESSTKVAVKTLKDSFTDEDTQTLIRECVLMHRLVHPNIISLIGLCLDAGPSPYIILPFMENGSLLSYVTENREILVTNANTDDEMACIAKKKLMDMCLQIAKGMEYLADMKLIHRDLAARNCMIDEHWIIKVADFGLSETLTNLEDRGIKNNNAIPLTTVKLPVKWTAPESLLEGIFSEKSDVWSYGVTCWEIFTAGTVPYPGVHPMTLARELSNGLRLYKPDNTACSDKMYAMLSSCWEQDPKLRPGFSELVQSIGEDFQGMIDYLYVSAFNNKQMTRKE